MHSWPPWKGAKGNEDNYSSLQSGASLVEGLGWVGCLEKVYTMWKDAMETYMEFREVGGS